MDDVIILAACAVLALVVMVASIGSALRRSDRENELFERAFMARCLSDGRSAFECEVLCRELDRGGKGCL